MFKKIVLGLIKIYQRTLSPDHGPLRHAFSCGGVCRYWPTCSAYAYEAIDRYGVRKGTMMAISRAGRCHPWGSEGYDPVPRQKING